MTKRECMEVEALSLIQGADPDTIKTLLKLFKLGVSSPGFMAAFAETTPPGLFGASYPLACRLGYGALSHDT